MPYRLHQFNSFRSINQHDRKTDYKTDEISADGSGERGTAALYFRKQVEVPAPVQVMAALERAPLGRTENGKPDMDGGRHVPRTDPGDLPLRDGPPCSFYPGYAPIIRLDKTKRII